MEGGGNRRGRAAFKGIIVQNRVKSMRRNVFSALILSAFALSACGHTIEQRAATGAVAGAVVAGPVGAVVGGAAGTAVGQAAKPH